jgi:hypothetical protein
LWPRCPILHLFLVQTAQTAFLTCHISVKCSEIWLHTLLYGRAIGFHSDFRIM